MRRSGKNGLDTGVPLSTKLLLGTIFLVMAAACSFCLIEMLPLEAGLQRYAYAIGFSLLLSGLLVTVMYTLMPKERFRDTPKPAFFYPLIAGGLALIAFSLSYIWMGVWPFGVESVMIVDMHHQYGPLLAHLREMILTGGSPLYTFEAGVGANFISMFGYYLASPFNLLLVLFPETLLTEGILVITLLKNVLSAVLFTACVQYILKKRNLSVALLALGYSLSMYMIAYSWNIMWLDGVLMLPLVVLGFERMMREGKYGVYVLSLAYTLFTNYYIGFMVCVFMVLYFIAFLVRKTRSMAEIGRAALRFTISSLIGGGLAMFILLPIVFALGYTSAAGEQLPDFNSTFQLFKLPAQQLFGVTPTIRSGNLPNIFCGILPALLVPLFVTTKTIPLRRRLAFGGLVAALGISCTVNVFDLIWHGLHTPNDLPYRFSFLYVFAVLLAGANLLPHLKDITVKQIGTTLACVVGYIAVYEMVQTEDANVFVPVYVSLLLCAIYCGILLAITRRKLALRTGYAALALVFVLEMTLGGGLGLQALNGNEYYTDRANYVANYEHLASANAVDKMVEIAEKETNGGFYRAELLPRRTCVDTALYHYKGLTSFSSSNYYHTTRLLGALGYADNGVNSYLYHSFVPLCDSLLSLQYLTLDVNLGEHPYLEMIDSTQTGDRVHYIYRNKLALPLAYRVESDIAQFEMQQYNPFGTQEDLLAAMTGDERKLYTFLPISIEDGYEEMGNTYNDSRFNVKGDGSSVWFKTTVTNDAPYYAFVDCTAAESASITTYDKDSNMLETWDASTNEPYIIDMGGMKKGDYVEISVTADCDATGNIFIASLDEKVMREKFELLADEGMHVTEFKQHSIKGSITATQNGTVFTTVPYDSSWQVTVDGKAVKTYPVGDLSDDESKGAFLAFDVTDGAHDIQMTFIPKGLLPGLLLSTISLVAFIILMIVTRRKRVAQPAPVMTPPVEDIPYAPKEAEPTPPEAELNDDVTLTDLLGEQEIPNPEPAPPVAPPMREFRPEDFQI